jgi:hypothetical protein
MSLDDSAQLEWDMPAISRSLREWFTHGKKSGFKYLLICQDTFDTYRDEDMGLYPHYSPTLDEAKQFQMKQLTGGDMLLEVLDLEQDMET